MPSVRRVIQSSDLQSWIIAPYSLNHFPPAEEEYVSNKVKVKKGAYQFFAKNYTDEQEQAIRKWCRSQGKGRVHCREDVNALWITFKAIDGGLATMFQLQFKE